MEREIIRAYLDFLLGRIGNVFDPVLSLQIDWCLAELEAVS